MKEKLFASTALIAWARDLRVIPLVPGTKKPVAAMTEWQGYLGALPSEETRGRWLDAYPDCNIGLLTGQQLLPGKRLLAIDVDDDRLIRTTRAMLSGKLIGKRGHRGETYFALFPMEGPKKLKKLKGATGLGNIDLLVGGSYTVMPPSVHPETELPYETVGKSLFEVDWEELPLVTNRELDILGVAIASEHALTLIGGKATHDAGVAFAAALVRAGATDVEITGLVRGFLPQDYDGNSLAELPGWIESARAKGFEPSDDESEGESLTAALVKLVRDGAELFHDGQGNAFATAEGLTLRVPSHALGVKLRSRAYQALSKPIGVGPLREAMATLEAVALHGDTVYRVHTRTAGDVRGIEVDLGRRDGPVVRITRDGWTVTSAASFRFVRGDGFGELPEPAQGGRLRDLQTFLRLDEENFLLIVAFLLNALRPGGPFFILLVEGEQSSGKSLLAEVIKRILDPNRAVRMRLPEKDHDLMIQAKEFAVLNFDNASGVKADMSDALCTLATGGGLAVRRLYTDGELSVLSFCRPLIINGIGGFVTRPDLMDRSIPIRLPPLPEGTRRTEEEIWREFDRLLPGLLGALYEAAASAMRNYDVVEPPTTLRMADAARWIRAAEEAVGVPPGGLVQAIRDAQDAFVVESVNDDPIVTKLRAVLKKGPFNGSVGDLFDRFDFVETRNLPRTPSQLSRHLKRLRPALAKVRIGVEFLPRTRQGQLIRIEATPSNDGGV